ncbi:MAG: FAD-dependent oxidoreductase [Desulfobacteraceae bacterium]
MERMFQKYRLGNLELANRFVFPPIKTGYGLPDGTVTERQLRFYGRIAKEGPGLVILEPVAVAPDGREHPKQLSVHFPESTSQLARIVATIHDHGRLAALHLNHAGAAANPRATQTPPKAPSAVTCGSTGQTAEPLSEEEIASLIEAFQAAAEKAALADFDLLELQGGHGYLISQFLNRKINQREDRYGQDCLLFAREALSAVRRGAPDLPVILRISGNEMSPEYGIEKEDLEPLLDLAGQGDVAAVHVGMGNSCFSPPWYFHHGSLPEQPQWDALSWVRAHTDLPLIVAGRMGRRERVQKVLDQGAADLVALGRPLLADPDLVEKWSQAQGKAVTQCGYCLQGCLHRLKNGEPLGCNVNPEMGLAGLEPSSQPKSVLVAGGGPAGMSAALYLSRRGHKVTLAESSDRLGGQFDLAWRAPGKAAMQGCLESLQQAVEASGVQLKLGVTVGAELAKELQPDLLVWATGSGIQNMPEIPGLENQHTVTSLDFFRGDREVKGPRVLVIGAGRVGLEIAEMLGGRDFEVVATKRTDPVGSHMEMITRKLALMRIDGMANVTLMPRTTVKGFQDGAVDLEQEGTRMSVEPFQTVILASGLLSTPGPDEALRSLVSDVEIIGDAAEVKDIFTAVHEGYRVAAAH